MFAKKVLGDSIRRKSVWGSHLARLALKGPTDGMTYMLGMEIAELFRFLD
jgi:hypothetical protein